jgi:hypothetical protein
MKIYGIEHDQNVKTKEVTTMRSQWNKRKSKQVCQDKLFKINLMCSQKNRICQHCYLKSWWGVWNHKLYKLQNKIPTRWKHSILKH